MITVHYYYYYYLRCEFVTVDKYVLRDCIHILSVCHHTSSHFPSALISCLYETENKYIFHSAVILLCYTTHTHTHTHTHTQSRALTHKNTVMKVARCSSAAVQYFCTVNAANIFPTSHFLFDFN